MGRKTDTSQIGTYLRICAGLIFLFYCTIYLAACPSAKLMTAVTCEAVVFLLSLLFIFNNSFYGASNPVLSFFEKLVQRFLPNKVTSKYRTIFAMARKTGRSIAVALLSSIVVLACIDLLALANAAFGSLPIAIAIYSAVPMWQLGGFHPAYSLEVLAGAYVDKGEWEKAESLYQAILKIRQNAIANRSDLMAAIYADLGDLSIRKRNLAEAESRYRKAFAIVSSSGRAATGLATTLREEGRLDEAEIYYKHALAARALKFGKQSKQYQDTLRGYHKLLQMRATRTD